MFSTNLQQTSLKNRITLISLGIFVLSIWALAFYASRMLREDLQKQAGEQQFSTVTIVAGTVDEQLKERLALLQAVAEEISPAMLANSASVQAFLEQSWMLKWHFNGGAMIVGPDGIAIADTQPLLGRIGTNYRETNAIAVALENGLTSVGRPVIGKVLKMPIFPMASPIRDELGRVIGAVSGVTNLAIPNFLDGITESRYGKTGGYLLVAPQSRLIVTATDKSRIMETLPARGVNPVIDAFLEGREGSAVLQNPLGVEILASDKGVPSSGWILASVLPTEEAFSPLNQMLQRLLLTTALLTLMAGGLSSWMLRRALSPLMSTAQTLSAISDGTLPLQPLAIPGNDEIGKLIGAFNRLLGILGAQQAALTASDRRFRHVLQDIPCVAIHGYGADGVARYWNRAAEKIYGYSAEEAIGRKLINLIIPSEMRREVRSTMRKMFETGIATSGTELSLVRKDGQPVTVFSNYVHVLVPGQAPEMFCVDIDLTESKRLEAALQQRDHYQRAVFDNFPFRVWLKDRQGRYLVVNQPFASACGWESPESLIGMCDLDISPPDLAEQYRADDRAVLSARTSKQIEELIQTESGRRWFETYKSPITAGGELIGVVGFARDINRYKQTEEALLAALANAEKANHDKSRFLAAASHDLRQPLSALSLYLGVLECRIPPDAVKLLASIQDCVAGLSDLLTDLLDVSKLSAGVVVPKPSGFCLDEMMVGLVSVHSVEAELKGLRLHWRHCGAIVHTDQTLLRRIVGNLLANAIGFTPRGGVLIGCRRHQGKLWLEVWDTGVGIAEDMLGTIFDEFRQLGDGARTRGSGLGLAIVEKTAKLLRLKVRVRSRPGRGSMFAVELPEGRVIESSRVMPSRLAARRLRIALVDDNESLRAALVLALEEAGHEVVGAPSGAGMLACLGHQAPDIVISDYRLAARENGFDVIQAARDRFGHELPAFLITGDTDPALIRSMADRGIAVHYKPFQIDVLQAFINDSINGERHEVAYPAGR